MTSRKNETISDLNEALEQSMLELYASECTVMWREAVIEQLMLMIDVVEADNIELRVKLGHEENALADLLAK